MKLEDGAIDTRSESEVVGVHNEAWHEDSLSISGGLAVDRPGMSVLLEPLPKSSTGMMEL
jgi:hypothetical protein